MESVNPLSRLKQYSLRSKEFVDGLEDILRSSQEMQYLLDSTEGEARAFMNALDSVSAVLTFLR